MTGQGRARQGRAVQGRVGLGRAGQTGRQDRLRIHSSQANTGAARGSRMHQALPASVFSNETEAAPACSGSCQEDKARTPPGTPRIP